jgi:hypothetical protein
MENSELLRLRFRGQYIITPVKIECPFIANTTNVFNNYTLYAHQDLKAMEYERNGTRIILLGDMFDYESPEKSNGEILEDLYDSDFNSLLEKLSKYSGRFVVIYLQHDSLKIVHDAMATRKVYYCEANNSFWFASQPILLSRILNLKPSVNSSKIAFYNSNDFVRLHNSNIGDTTYFDEIHQLLPNHYYDFASNRSVRYWPNKKIVFLPVSMVAGKCSQMIKGYVESIGKRYNIMLPVTSGKDSRTIMAGTRSFKDKVFYYINKDQKLKETSRDIKVPKRLFSKLNLDYHIVNPYIPIDELFKKAYFQNNEYASSNFLPHIYNYYKNFSDKVNLPGNNASSAFEIFTERKLKASAMNLARLNKVDKYDYAVQYYEKWLSGSREICIQNNINIINLFYWEERLANWGTQIQLEKDIAQEDLNPFNSRQLIELFLSVKPKYTELPNYILYKKIIHILWPELLLEPINPSFENGLRKILIFMGIHQALIKFHHVTLDIFNSIKKPSTDNGSVHNN